ncbi:MAG: VanW family protein [Dehalococcoidia bacterium]|nr:VanW family protein [Dehalococcoidia bacterium]
MVGFFVLVAAAVFSSYQIVYSQRIPLGVQILDMDVGGLDAAGAKRLLSDNLDAYLRTPLALRYDGREIKGLPGELGASFNVDQSVSQALKLGQDVGVVDKVQRQVTYLQHPLRMDLAFVFNDVAFQGGVARLAKDIEQPPQDAAIKLVGAETTLSPSRPGSKIDRTALQKRLTESFSTLSSTPMDIPVQSIPPQVKEEDLAQARKQIDSVFASPVTVKYGNKKWTLDKTTLSGLVIFQQTKDASGAIRAQTSVAPDKASAWAEGVAKEVDVDAQDVRLAWNGGKVSIVSPGRPGVSVEAAKFGDALNKALAKGDRVVDLPVVAVQPAGTGDVASLGIKEKIAGASTSYAGSIPERAHNIALGSQRTTGTVVPPGGVFSMNDTVGDVSQSSGYQLGFAIVGADTVPDFGGGICQVVTTVFKAAFAAGFPVVERTNHLYLIEHYVPVLGVEATIYQPGVDMKFKNDTDRYILIEALTGGGNVTVNIYGTKPDREVSIEAPILSNVVPTDRTVIRQESPVLAKGTEVMTEAAEDGMDVTVYRSIKVGGKEVRRDKLSSHYRPAHNVVLAGTRE